MKYLIQSLATFLGLYGLVFAVADALYFQRSISPTWIVALAGTLVTLQYLLSPWFIRNLLNIDWDDDGSALPARNRQFLEQLCARHGLTVPQIGVIHASMPNAFAFGRTRSDAGIVVTSSLLERLTPDEVNAVIAHELGHIKNWDFLAMTLAALAPLLLYQLYSFARRGKEEHWATWASYAAYWVAEFLVLSLSRTREYAADHFATQSTGQPGLLASALIKIGYGIGLAEHELAGAAKSEDEGVKANAVAQRRISGTIGVLGISNGNGALALSGLAPGAAGGVMLWDMVNPWALVYEIGSTHPLMAHRIDALNRQAQQLGQPVEYPVPRAPMQWGRFPLELFLWAAPWTLFAALSIITALHRVQLIAAPHLLGETIVFAFLATWIARIWYRYQTPFAPATFAALLANTSVSNIRPTRFAWKRRSSAPPSRKRSGALT